MDWLNFTFPEPKSRRVFIKHLNLPKLLKFVMAPADMRVIEETEKFHTVIAIQPDKSYTLGNKFKDGYDICYY